MAPSFRLINAGAFYRLLLGYLYPHKIFELLHELSSHWHVIKLHVCMLSPYWLQGFSTKLSVPKACWSWWRLIFSVPKVCWFESYCVAVEVPMLTLRSADPQIFGYRLRSSAILGNVNQLPNMGDCHMHLELSQSSNSACMHLGIMITMHPLWLKAFSSTVSSCTLVLPVICSMSRLEDIISNHQPLLNICTSMRQCILWLWVIHSSISSVCMCFSGQYWPLLILVHCLPGW
jgi:hypothetical protein